MSVATASRPYAWLQLLVFMMTVVTLAITGIAFHQLQTSMVKTAGESLSLTAVGIAEKLDALMLERQIDVLMLARARIFQEHDAAAMVKYLGSSHLQVGHSVVRPSTNALAEAAIQAFPAA